MEWTLKKLFNPLIYREEDNTHEFVDFFKVNPLPPRDAVWKQKNLV